MQKLYEAILGEKNRIYYLMKFDSFDQSGPGLKASWNWFAALFCGVWALYRKMYGWFFAWWGLVTLFNISEETGSSDLILVPFIAAQILFGVYANSLYHNSIKKKIAVAQLEIEDESKLLEYLRYKGGVNTWVWWVWISFFVLGVLAAIFLPMLV